MLDLYITSAYILDVVWVVSSVRCCIGRMTYLDLVYLGVVTLRGAIIVKYGIAIGNNS